MKSEAHKEELYHHPASTFGYITFKWGDINSARAKNKDTHPGLWGCFG